VAPGGAAVSEVLAPTAPVAKSCASCGLATSGHGSGREPGVDSPLGRGRSLGCGSKPRRARYAAQRLEEFARPKTPMGSEPKRGLYAPQCVLRRNSTTLNAACPDDELSRTARQVPARRLSVVDLARSHSAESPGADV
jgi:hypothetical protein